MIDDLYSGRVLALAADMPRDPRRQHRIVVELVAEPRWFLEERHAENVPR